MYGIDENNWRQYGNNANHVRKQCGSGESSLPMRRADAEQQQIRKRAENY